MDKLATSLFKSKLIASARRAKTEKTRKAVGKELDSGDFERSNYLKAQKNHAISVEKRNKTDKMVDGKLSKKFRGVVKSIKKKLSVGDFFKGKMSPMAQPAMA